MKLKDVYPLITGVALISTPENNQIRYGNAFLREPTEEMMQRKVKEIEPFYRRTGLYRFGVIIRLTKKTKSKALKEH